MNQSVEYKEKETRTEAEREAKRTKAQMKNDGHNH